MAREQSEVQKKAFQMWCSSGRTMKPAAIAAELDVSPALIRKWKNYYKWEEQEDPKPRGRGAPKGNKNAAGNNGGAPPGNDNAVKHGLFRKFMPQDDDFLEIRDMVVEMDPLEMIWENIVNQFTAIIRAPSIMHVTSKNEMIKELKKRKFEVVPAKNDKGYEQAVIEEEYEFQWAWDRYATFLKAQSAAMGELRGAIKQFLNAAPEHDERRLKLGLMTAQIEKVKADATLVDERVKKIAGNQKDASLMIALIEGRKRYEERN